MLDITAVAAEDLGYLDGAGEGGEERAWHLDVTDGRLGAETGSTIRITMVVGERRDGDLFASNGCGMDDNLLVGESYEVVSVAFDGMISCGSSVVGPRAPVPDRGSGATERWPLAAAAAVLAIGGGAGIVGWRRRESS